MKLLFDQNLSFRLCRQLADLFPDSNQVRLLDLSEADDRTIWDYARDNHFVLMTQDSDFAELAGLLGAPPKVIWLRSGNQPTSVVERTLRHHAQAIVAFEADSAAASLEIY